jgi:LPXTG-motif cell wall-anchored protein
VIKVSFPVAALGGAGTYRYALNAGHTEGQAAGDLAPDAGLSRHRLGAIAGPADAAPPGREAATTSAPQANLPTTGPDQGRALLPIAGAAFMVGGALLAAGPRRCSSRGVL